MKRSWVEIVLNQIKKNYLLSEKTISLEQNIMAVAKVNAYGHGDVQVAKTLFKLVVKDFAVFDIGEAIKLCMTGIGVQILILWHTPVKCASCLYKYDITQSLLSENYAKQLCKQGSKIKT